MTKFFLLLALIGSQFHNSWATVPPTSAEKAYYWVQNPLSNPGFEQGKTGWTASGGTFSITTTAANVSTGAQAASWDSSASTQTFTSTAVTIPPGWYASNGVLRCRIQVPSGTATHTIGLWNGTTLTNTQTVTSSASYTATTVNFIIPSSGTMAIRITSVNANEPNINIDDCQIGLADNLGSTQFTTPWKNDLTFTVGGMGTITNSNFWYRREGDSLRVRGSFTSGTTAATTFFIQLPTGYTIDSSKFSTDVNAQLVGTINTRNTVTNAIYTGGTDGIIFYDGSTTNQVFPAQSSGATSVQFTKINGSSFFGSGKAASFDFSVPVTQFNDGLAYRPDTAALSWSGYTNSISGGCSTTSTTFADPSACTSIALTELTNRNFGTVTTAGSSLPGILWTPVRSGRYLVCSTPAVSNSSAGADMSARLTDGTTVFYQGSAMSLSTANNASNIEMCGIYNATQGVATTIKIQLATSTGTLKIATAIQGGGTVSNINWSIFALDQQFPAPVFVGSVTSSSTGAERIERVSFGGTTEGTNTCTTTPCTIYRQSGSWISSVTRVSTGNYTLNILSGTFSGTPTCITNPGGTSSDTTGYTLIDGTTSATSVKIKSFTNALAATDGAFNVICMGQR